MNSETAITVDQMKEISETMIRAIPKDLSPIAALHWTHSKSLLIKRIRQILVDDGARDLNTVLQEWTLLYEKCFQLKKDFSDIKIPKSQPGFNRLLIVAKDLLLDKTISVCEGSFPTNSEVLGEFGNRFNKMVYNDREAITDYALWVRDIAESEVEPMVSDQCQLVNSSVPKITLLERLLFEIKYFSETGEHLDTEKVTCCFGSIYTEGNERPVVCWRNNHLRILWRDISYTNILMSCSPFWSRSIII